MEGTVWNFYNLEEIWRGLFKIFILIKRYNKQWRDLEGVIWSYYNWGGILRYLFRAFILVERYYKKWRKLFGALIFKERFEGSCLKLLYQQRDIKEAVWSFYIREKIL